MADQSLNPDVDYILTNGERLVTVTTRCAFSLGTSDGLNDLLLVPDEPDAEWRQPIAVMHRDAVMMAALRLTALLDRDLKIVSFQAVYHLLKNPDVVKLLLKELEARHGSDDNPPSRADLINDYLATYSEIDWKVHGRLTHFRNRGIAHLTIEKMQKSVTLPELRTLADILARLAATLQHLCQTGTAFHVDIRERYQDLARRIMKNHRANLAG